MEKRRVWEIEAIDNLFSSLHDNWVWKQYYHYFLIEFHIIELDWNSVYEFHKQSRNMCRNTKQHDRYNNWIFCIEEKEWWRKQSKDFLLQIFVFCWSWNTRHFSRLNIVDVNIKYGQCFTEFRIRNWILIIFFQREIIFEKMCTGNIFQIYFNKY